MLRFIGKYHIEWTIILLGRAIQYNRTLPEVSLNFKVAKERYGP
jgi:hypothetical protein